MPVIQDTSSIDQSYGRDHLPGNSKDTFSFSCGRPDSLYSYYQSNHEQASLLNNIVSNAIKIDFTLPAGNSKEIKNQEKVRILNQVKEQKVFSEAGSNEGNLVIINRPSIETDWMVVIILTSLILLTWIRLYYGKFLILTLKSATNSQTSDKFFRERNTLTQRVSFTLNAVFMLNFSLFICQVLKYNNLQLFDLEEPVGFFVILFFIVLVHLFKYLIYKLIGYLFKMNKLLLGYIHNMFVYNKAFGIVLFPVITAIPFLPETLRTISEYSGFCCFIFVLFAQIIRGIKIFMYGGVSIYYLILYLCALEILPLLVLYKFVLTLL